ncbi:MAG: hypothetical protein R6U96_16010 [Promethearchaeia archaeon]
MVKINPYFKRNWLKILKFNESIKIIDKTSESREKIRIPLTTLHIDPFYLHHLFDEMYPKFINDQQNIADVIISEDNSEIEAIYLYVTPKAGIHDSYKKLPNDIVKFRTKDLANIGDFFNKLQFNIFEKEKIRISSLRLFKAGAIAAINKHCKTLKTAAFFESLKSFISLNQTLMTKNLFHIYPEPNAYRFIKEFITFFKDIDLSEMLEKVLQILPNFNIALIIGSSKITFILRVQNRDTAENEKDLGIEIYSPSELELVLEDLTKNELLNHVNSKLKTDSAYYFHLEHIIVLLSDILELQFPPEKNKFNLVMQKMLYGYRSFEKNWYMVPRPLIYYSIIRFLLRLIGINLNLKKLSHWSIPRLVSNAIDSFIGLNSKVIILITETIKSRNDTNEQDFYKVDVDSVLLLEFEKRNLVNFQLLDKEPILDNLSEYTLENLRNQMSLDYGFINNIIKIDLQFIQDCISQFGFHFSRFNPLSKLSIIKKVKKQRYFQIYPENPMYKFIKESGTFSLLKSILALLIDKHEF